MGLNMGKGHVWRDRKGPWNHDFSLLTWIVFSLKTIRHHIILQKYVDFINKGKSLEYFYDFSSFFEKNFKKTRKYFDKAIDKESGGMV